MYYYRNKFPEYTSSKSKENYRVIYPSRHVVLPPEYIMLNDGCSTHEH